MADRLFSEDGKMILPMKKGLLSYAGGMWKQSLFFEMIEKMSNQF